MKFIQVNETFINVILIIFVYSLDSIISICVHEFYFTKVDL